MINIADLTNFSLVLSGFALHILKLCFLMLPIQGTEHFITMKYLFL